MPRLYIRKKIMATPNTIYEILMNSILESKWNLIINNKKKIGINKWYSKTSFGDIISIRTNEIKNKKISFKIENKIFTKMGYIFSSKDDISYVVLWVEFNDEVNRKELLTSGYVILKSLKRFAEHIEEGRDPNEFNKNFVLLIP